MFINKGFMQTESWGALDTKIFFKIIKEKLDYESKRTSLPRGKIIDGLVENLKTNALASP